MEAIFSLSGLLVMTYWALMIFLPHWRWTLRITALCSDIGPSRIVWDTDASLEELRRKIGDVLKCTIQRARSPGPMSLQPATCGRRW